MISKICIYEDSNCKNLLPLVYFRPVYDLKCGFRTLREKIEQNYKRAPKILHARKYLKAKLLESNEGYSINSFDGESILFINGRILADKSLSKNIPLKGDDALYSFNDSIVAARLSGRNLEMVTKDLDEFINFNLLNDIKQIEVDVVMIDYPWDLINKNAQELVADINTLKIPSLAESGKTYKGTHLINKKRIFIDKNCTIKPNVVIEAEKGPVCIGRNVTIFPNAYLQGPLYIGENSEIKSNAVIQEGTTIGEVCKIGGEIENSIIHSYSNKQHDGFLGHSYICSWVNIGASTNNSDLKNNYGNIKVTLNGESIDSGSQFVGLMMGDHSKTAINTMFNTGTVVGVASNIFGAGFPRRYLPSFTFGGTDIMRSNTLQQSIEVAEIVFDRRKYKMTNADKDLFKKIFELTEKERVKYLR